MTARRLAALLALAPMSVAALAAAPPSAQAAPGTFGAARAQYLDGSVCVAPGGASTPLASWDLVAGAGPAFLAGPLTSDGAADSAVVPSAANGAQTLSDVVPGTFGFASDEEIAIYAAMVSALSASDPVGVAQAVLARAGSPAPSSCADPSAPAALVERARSISGPYTVSVSAQPGPGSRELSASATVLSASGAPAPGVKVVLSVEGGSAAEAATDAEGTASARITAGPGDSARVTAQASVPLGLRLVSAVAPRTAANPSGSSVPALIASEPVPYTAHTDLLVDRTASPAALSGSTAAAIGIGGSFSPTARISGMRGHEGTAALSIVGPLAFGSAHACPDAGDPAWQGAPEAAASTAPIHGDGPVTGAPFAAQEPGCYAVRTVATSTSATPNSSGSSAFSAAVAVIDATATVEPDRLVIGAGQVTAKAVLEDAAGGSIVSASLAGPVPAGYLDGCASVDWAGAPVIPVTSSPDGDGAALLASAATAGPGCYRLTGTADVQVEGIGSVAIPLTSLGADGGPRMEGAVVISLAPSVSVSMAFGSVAVGEAAELQVAVAGSFGHGSRIRVDMLWAPHAGGSCAGADFSAARVVSSSETVAADGDGSFPLTTAATTELGCYAPVPVLVMEENASVTASGRAGERYTVITAGVDPSGAHGPLIRSQPSDSLSEGRIRATAMATAALLVLAVAAAGAAAAVGARADRRRDEETERDGLSLIVDA